MWSKSSFPMTEYLRTEAIEGPDTIAKNHQASIIFLAWP